MNSQPSTINHQPLTDYPAKTIQRAARALACSPFKLQLFVAMCNQSVPLPTIADGKGTSNNYTKNAITENDAESYLIWLINVGLLRREVDGQGLTDSFRLTPLGRTIIADWETSSKIPDPSLSDKLVNSLNRWLRLSF